MRDFLQFLIKNFIATVAAIVSLIVGIIEIAKFIKDSKGKNKKTIMVVGG
ncbi:MAG: hypothetical protein IJA07_08035 [Agathobacter sp.]|nr:hypothetical protein [Agathobacter sp.]